MRPTLRAAGDWAVAPVKERCPKKCDNRRREDTSHSEVDPEHAAEQACQGEGVGEIGSVTEYAPATGTDRRVDVLSNGLGVFDVDSSGRFVNHRRLLLWPANQ